MTNEDIDSPPPVAVDDYVRAMTVTRPLVDPLVQRVIEALQVPQASRGLDVGCGLGSQTLLLAEAVGSQGRMVGLDREPRFVQHARVDAAAQGFSERVRFQQADVRALPFADRCFDWVWSANFVGYAAFDPLPALGELARVVRPGGTVILAAWSAEKLLPGHPQLEARLGATAPGIAPFVEGQPPERHFLRTMGWLQRLGLVDLRAQTFVHDLQAPLSPELREALIALFRMRWPGVEAELSPEDQELFQYLCDPASAGFVLDAPDYFAFYTYTLFQGKVPS